MTKTKVDFWLVGDIFEPDKITNELDIKPTKARLKKNSPIPQTAATYWKLSTEKEECTAISEPFEKLVELLQNKESIIIKLCQQLGLTATFEVVIEMEINDRPELVLTKDIIQFANAIQAEIGFDLYID
ncbi:DUF4279 domain-containing protein [Paenibacillus wenxiniae]|uniref:DUF4279 domain-containing protein n=1 Tax=Paenibacillus wenxiniae TaxID=1636843 RepID=A0ABW4REJ1_9BACL